MLYVRIELWPRGNRKVAKLLHEGIVFNGGGTREVGKYVAHFSRSGGFSKASDLPRGQVVNPLRSAEVKGFPRLRLSAWHLLLRALTEALRVG